MANIHRGNAAEDPIAIHQTNGERNQHSVGNTDRATVLKAGQGVRGRMRFILEVEMANSIRRDHIPGATGINNEATNFVLNRAGGLEYVCT